MNRFRPSLLAAWRTWHKFAMESFAYCRVVPARALVFGESERYALLCARARSRRDRIEKELARLLDSNDRASLHALAHAYVTEWVSALGQMLEALQFARETEADSVILRAQSALMRRWTKIDGELGRTTGASPSH